MSTPPAPAELAIKPSSTVYDAGDGRWAAQVQTLLASLQANVGPVRQDVTPVAGRKGGMVGLVIALGSAGAITAAVEVFKAWLARDTTRSITITTTVDGVESTRVITGTNISKELLAQAMTQSAPE